MTAVLTCSSHLMFGCQVYPQCHGASIGEERGLLKTGNNGATVLHQLWFRLECQEELEQRKLPFQHFLALKRTPHNKYIMPFATLHVQPEFVIGLCFLGASYKYSVP
jgi:hypothetical protein